jgi:hypothetical protein
MRYRVKPFKLHKYITAKKKEGITLKQILKFLSEFKKKNMHNLKKKNTLILVKKKKTYLFYE